VNVVFGVEGDGIKSYVNCNYNTFTNNNVSNFYITGIRVAHGADNNIIQNNTINGNSNAIQYGIRILANTLAQYNAGLTFGDQLTADDNNATLNNISNVNVGVLVGDEKSFPPTNRVGNVITPNTFTNVTTDTISS
jgi:parallel beta-helix repeat protein